MSEDRLQEMIEAAVERQVGERLDLLSRQITTQNGRVGMLERRADVMDERWNIHDHWTPEEKRQVLDAVGKMEQVIVTTLQREMARRQLEADAARWQQLRTMGYRLVAALIFGVPLSTVFMEWLFSQWA